MFLVSLDADQIKHYVFSTRKLKEIRGASSILDELNEIDIPKLIGAHRVIYAGGGSILAEADSLDEAQNLIRESERLYRCRTISAEITGDCLEMKESETFFGTYARRLGFKIRLRKDEKAGHITRISSPVLKTCQSCGQLPASQHITIPEENFICSSCDIKRKRSDQIKEGIHDSLLKQLIEYAQSKGQWHGFSTFSNAPNDFEEIGESAFPKGYIGFIYCDGNRIGDLFSDLDRSTYGKLSKGLRKTLREAIFDTLCSYFKDLIPQQKFPFEIIFIGGDDLVMVVAADKAMDIALNLINEFEKRSAHILAETELSAKRKRISLSAAVVLSHASLPIYHLQAIADDLLILAKRRSHKIRVSQKEEVGCIDFQVITASASQLPSIIRRVNWRRHEESKLLSMTERPYTAKEMETLIAKIRDLQSTNFPRSKLHMLFESIMDKSMAQSMYTWAFVAGRSKRNAEDPTKDQFSKLISFFDMKKIALSWPWHKSEPEHFGKHSEDGTTFYTTPLVDVVELYEFVKLKKMRSAGSGNANPIQS
jgi:CRISPR/Cas system-associated protein Cas10 (large subunit of type III CRISPR-Cas system)